jgi:C-terminal processing protease CtpA/Prc
MPLTEKQKADILNRVKRIVLEKHINVANPGQNYSAWVATMDDTAHNLVRASDEEFESGVRHLLTLLGSSHTGFYRKNGEIPAPHSIHATLSPVKVNGRDAWMFLDIVEDGAAFRAGIQPGLLLLSIDGSSIAPPKVPTFRIGAKHRLSIGRIGTQDSNELEIEIPDKPAKDRPPMIEPRSVASRILDNGIGYVKVASFPGTVGLQFAAALYRVLDDFKQRDCKRLVVDLRGNVGGGLGSLRLMSYLCPGKLPIGYSLTRRRLKAGYNREKLPRIDKIPASKVEQIGMAIRFKVFQRDRSLALFTEGMGNQAWHGRTVVLINEHTASAAEMVASFVKEHRLATLIGTKTSGQVLGGANFSMPGGYTLRIPVAGWYSPTSSRIEGCGVEPDLAVTVKPEFLGSGQDEQLQTACECLVAGRGAWAVP